MSSVLARLRQYPGPVRFILIPLLLAAIYYFVFAADRYVSESKIAIKQTGAMDVTGFQLGGTLLGGGEARQDAFFLREHILSADMLAYLDGKFDLRRVYAAPKLDVIHRLWAGATRDDFLEYYRSRVDVVYDETASIVAIRTQGFDPKFAQQLNEAIVQQSERFINDISHKIAGDQMRFMEQELRVSLDRLRASKDKLLAFQNKHRVFDPAEEAKAMAGYINTMESELAAHEAELGNLKTFLSAESFQVKSLQNKINALRAQMDRERARISGGGKVQLNQLSSQFQELQSLSTFAGDVYKSTLVALETSRVDASKKLKNLVIIASPTLPEEAEQPRRTYILLTLAVVLSAVYGIAMLIIATIKDHRD